MRRGCTEHRGRHPLGGGAGSDGKTGWYELIDIASTDTTYTISDLQPLTPHEIQVRGLFDADEDKGAWPDSITVSTKTSSVTGTATGGAETAAVATEILTIPDPTVWILATGTIYANELNGAVWFSLITAEALTDNFTVNVTVTESHNMLQSTSTSPVEFFAGAGNAVLSVAIDNDNDNTSETDSTVTATIMPGTGYRIVSPSSASQTVVDDD